MTAADGSSSSALPRRNLIQRLRSMDRDRLEQIVVGYAFVLPDVLGLLIFMVGPMVMAFVISFTDWRLVGTPQYVGTHNYGVMLDDPRFIASLKRTFSFTLYYVPLVYTLSLGMAVLLRRRSRANGFFRTIYFMPVAMSLVVAGVIWRFMFDPGNGLINTLLGTFGLPTFKWIGSVDTAMYSVIIVSVWKSAGYFMIILLAGIEDIPQDYIEAAQIDGANRWRVFRHIIMPLLRPTSFFVLVILVINGLQAFDQIYVMTRGGPAYATHTLLIYMYDKAFRQWNFGYAAAMSVTLFLIIFVLTLIQVRYFRASEVRE
ncbi:MAG: sugar ABC transporter permease [Anaerolineae bacterium]|nr:sugar ABC transporter permease [Anaerolineae bacterium]